MCINNTITTNSIRGIVVLAIVFAAILQSYSVCAQSRMKNAAMYVGFGASFGVRSQVLQSNYAAIDRMNVVQEGGTAILVGGNRIFRAKLETGFYYSSSAVPHTVDLFELGASVNVYPFQFVTKEIKRVEPYFIAGFSQAAQKFHGYYHLEDGAQQKINYSVSSEPYIGKSVTSLATIGTGLEYRLRDDYNFVHIFAEARYSKAVAARNSLPLEQTSFAKQVAVNVGVAFGLHR